jgi:hypothetical protein
MTINVDDEAETYLAVGNGDGWIVKIQHEQEEEINLTNEECRALEALMIAILAFLNKYIKKE